MYKIIGADQKEYGPVSSEQIQQWITLGRVNAQTKTQLNGGEWKPLGDFPEFAAVFGSNVPPLSGPPPLSQTLTPAQPTKTSGLAIASLVLGILGFFSCGITALIGLILGIASMRQVRRSNGTIGGGGIALAGTIVSAVFLLLIPGFMAAMLLPALSTAKQRAQSIQCVNNLKQLSLAARIYAGDNGEHFPTATNWCDALKPFVGDSARVYKCAAADSTDTCDYGINVQVAGLDSKSVNPQTVLFFESKNGWNLSGGSEMVINPPRHRTGPRNQNVNIAFADGHVEQVRLDRLSQLRWEP
jgi:prepilin-type processing-associated H-X9-DG protein